MQDKKNNLAARKRNSRGKANNQAAKVDEITNNTVLFWTNTGAIQKQIPQILTSEERAKIISGFVKYCHVCKHRCNTCGRENYLRKEEFHHLKIIDENGNINTKLQRFICKKMKQDRGEVRHKKTINVLYLSLIHI